MASLETNEPLLPPPLGDVVDRRYALWLLLRVVVTGAFILAGLAWLGFLYDATPGAGVLHLSNDPAWILWRTATLTLLPILYLSALGEAVILLVSYLRADDRYLQTVPPLVTAVFSGVLGYVIFPEAALVAKVRLLVAGAMLAGFLASSVQVSLWYLAHGVGRVTDRVPTAWYVVLLVLGSVFAGSAHAWLYSPHPMVRELLTAQEKHRANERVLETPTDNTPLIP